MEDTIKGYLDNIINDDLYINNSETSEKTDKIKVITNFLNNSKNYFSVLRNIISSRNNENYFKYNEYVIYFISNSSLDTKLDFINNYNKCEDIIGDFNNFSNIWFTISDNDKIKYLNSKKNLSLLDNYLINASIKKATKKNDKLLKEILKNSVLRNKITLNSIEITSPTLLTNIDLTDLTICNIFTKRSYSNLLLKKCKSFKDFVNIYESNNKIFDLIEKNSLIFKSKDNEVIHDFIMENPSFIGKFNHKYLDLFSVIEISKLSKDKKQDSEAYSTLLAGMYKYDTDIANSLFHRDSLKKCSIHSIAINPFHYLSDSLKNEIFNDYNLFNRFIDTIMIEAINECFLEDDIVNILRNDTFVDDMSPYAIELLINKLSFKSSFNMLQRQNILAKVNNLNISISDNDVFFIKGFLDSPSLIYKSQHTMIWDMLNHLNKDDLLYYINLPYIVNKLSNMDIIKLVSLKELSVDSILSLNSLNGKFNKADIVNLINSIWKRQVDLSIFTNSSLVELIFSKDICDKVDFMEVNYLYETIRMKSMLSKQFTKCTIENYTAVLVSYMTLGLDNTLKLINNGNSNITLDMVQKLQRTLINEKIIDYKDDNSYALKDINKNVINNLNSINSDDLKKFKKDICNNTYLDNIVYLMVKTNYDNYEDIINNLYGYVCCKNNKDNISRTGLINYLNGFVNKYIDIKIDELNKIFENNILKHFKLKEEIIYSMMKEHNKVQLRKAKFKLFVRALTEPNKEFFKNYFKSNFPIDKIQDKYLKYIDKSKDSLEDIIDHILMPIVNERFDIYNALDKLGVSKPIYYDDYCKYLDDIKNLSDINHKFDKLKRKFYQDKILDMMNYVVYGVDVNFKISKTMMDKLKEYKDIISTFDGKVFIDKSVMKLGYKDDMDIYNLDEITEYISNINIVNKIIDKTYTYVNNNMLNSCILEYQNRLIDIEINSDLPISNEYFELKRRVYSLDDIEKIFNGYDLSKLVSMDKELKGFFDKHVNYLVDGYYDNIVNNFGLILSNYKEINTYIKKNKLSDVSIIDIENILTIINFDNSIIGNYVCSSTLRSLWNYSHYEVDNLKMRINMLFELVKNSFKCVSSTIPYLSCKYDNITIRTIDKYDKDFIKVLDGSQYIVGSIGNDFLHYCLLNKNGLAIGIYDGEELVGKIYGIRHGNTVYLNTLEGNVSEDISNYLKSFANELINITSEDIDSINFVTIVNNHNYNGVNDAVIDNTLCPLINYPFGVDYDDFDSFISDNNLVNPNYIYTNYGDNISTLLASNLVIDKDNFKYYDVDAKYRRKRNISLKLSSNMDVEELNKIKLIMEIAEYPTEKIEKFNFASYKSIYLGDDYVIFDNNRDFAQFILPYDTRAMDEVDKINKIMKEKV